MSKEVELSTTNPSTDNPHPQKPVAEEKTIPFSAIFPYLSFLDSFWMLIGTIGALAQGACNPLYTLVFGEIPNSLGPTVSLNSVVDSAGALALKFIYLGLASFVTGYLGYFCWIRVCEKATNGVRRNYFQALLHQGIGSLQSTNQSKLSAEFSEQCSKIQQGLGENFALLFSEIGLIITCFIIMFSKDWKLSAILAGFVFIIGCVSGLMNFSKKQDAVYLKEGTIFKEVMNRLRTIVSFSKQQEETERYEKTLEENSKAASKYAVLSGISRGLQNFLLHGIPILGFYAGSSFLTKKENDYWSRETSSYTVGDVYTVILSILALFNCSYSPEQFIIAKANAAEAFGIIDRTRQISVAEEQGLKPASCKGLIKFRDAKFGSVVNGVSFDVRPGEITAFVGDSGKNVCSQLIERIHDIEDGKGSISLDGNELKEINRNWVRENISYIGQEPVLFATSIKENLTMAKEDATDAEIWEVLKKANAADFVQNLPDKLNTSVGNKEAPLSGAQKHRLAFSRALLKNPTILLLDEFTKNLNKTDENEILKTILENSQGRTVIIVTNRLSTSTNADHIIVFEEGKVAEEGNHEHLIAKKGKYHAQFQDQVESPPNIQEEEEIIVNHDSRSEKEKEEESDRLLDESNLKELLTASNASEDKSSQIALFKRFLNYSKDDLPLLIIGSLSAILAGCSISAFVILTSNMLNILGDPSQSNFSSRFRFFLSLFVVNALVSFIANSIISAVSGLIDGRLSRRIRKGVFRQYVRMPVGWFDEPTNNPQVLQNKLLTDMNLLNQMIMSVFTSSIHDITLLITLLAISFIADWRIAFVALVCSPLLILSNMILSNMILSNMIQNRFSNKKTEVSSDAYQESHVFASEALNNIRTAASFSSEDKLLEKYSEKLLESEKISMKNTRFSAFTLGGRGCLSRIFYAITFYIGALVMRDHHVGFVNMFMSIMAMIYASLPISTVFQKISNIRSAQEAAINIFRILDTKPALDIDASKQTLTTPILGNIEFKKVWFRDSNKGKQILKNFNLKIEASKKTALVDPSGCGNSIILDLIQRFYDVDSGEVLIDGVNIKQYDLKHLRRSFGLISKEPVLFDGTIASNIKYIKFDSHLSDLFL